MLSLILTNGHGDFTLSLGLDSTHAETAKADSVLNRLLHERKTQYHGSSSSS